MTTFNIVSMCISSFVFGWSGCDLLNKYLAHRAMRQMQRDMMRLGELLKADVKQGVETLEEKK